jgi:hypothetical protein
VSSSTDLLLLFKPLWAGSTIFTGAARRVRAVAHDVVLALDKGARSRPRASLQGADLQPRPCSHPRTCGDRG